ncbi:MAG: hypothetical protein ACWGMZ_00170 [Thermoguttaceae bacterium]
MLERKLLPIIVLLLFTALQAWGQYPVDDNSWHKSVETSRETPDQRAQTSTQARTHSESSSTAATDNRIASRSTAKFSSLGSNFSLPNDAGQVWREYDISPYTTRVTNTQKPEQAIIDWILRETGYEAWHCEPFCILSANSRTLRVYHKPEMQRLVADLVDRFVSSEAATQTFALRVITLDSPSWRAKAQPLLRPVPVQTPGVCAWVLPKEDAAILWADLRRRPDYREHSSPYLMVNNGQSTIVSAMRNRPYSRDVLLRPDLPTGCEIQTGQVEEGFTIDFSPLLSRDRRMIDAVVKCNIDQVEKMLPIMLDVPARNLPRQRIKIEEPQVIQYRFQERFHWPADQVLLISMGMVALPVPVDGRPLVPGFSLPFGTTPARAELLVLVENKGQLSNLQGGVPTMQQEAKTYRGRY